MEKQLSNFLNYRSEIQVLDATLRDGGLVNKFVFSDEFVKALYEANRLAGVDYMEFGYKASKNMFSEKDFGKWKFCKDDDIRAIVGDSPKGPKVAVMADVGRCDFKEDIKPKSESPIDMIRVATYVHQIPGAIEMIEDAKNKGYEVSCNIMSISNCQESDVRIALDLIGKSPVDVIYIVDSFGALYPENIARVCAVYRECADKHGKQLGIHAHNNLQMAFANTIECVGDGVNYLDATYAGMGRGAGNCAMELLLGFLKNPKYKEFEAFKFVENYMNPLRKAGVVWGYDMQYLMTGLLNQHPRAAIAFTEAGREDYSEFYKELIMLD